jgi:putative FmdB family regulatory protein
MPTYEYACRQCGEHLEVVQSFHDDALSVCHNCGGELKKVFGNIGIVFKGSGFYRNDSRKTTESTSSSGSPATKESPSPATPAAPSAPSPSTSAAD